MVWLRSPDRGAFPCPRSSSSPRTPPNVPLPICRWGDKANEGRLSSSHRAGSRRNSNQAPMDQEGCRCQRPNTDPLVNGGSNRAPVSGVGFQPPGVNTRAVVGEGFCRGRSPRPLPLSPTLPRPFAQVSGSCVVEPLCCVLSTQLDEQCKKTRTGTSRGLGRTSPRRGHRNDPRRQTSPPRQIHMIGGR